MGNPDGDSLPPPVVRYRDAGYLDAGAPDPQFMPMNRVVTFDTNAYRTLALGLDREEVTRSVGRLRRVERLGGIQALASPWVILELCSHLGNPGDPAFSHCLLALQALHEHCADAPTANPLLAMLGDSESQLCVSLYDEHDPESDRQLHAMGTLAKIAAETPASVTADPYRGYYQNAAQELRRLQAVWAEELRREVLERFLPGATSWADVRSNAAARRAALRALSSEEWVRSVARLLVTRTMTLLRGAPWDDPDIDMRVDWVAREFPAALAIYTEFVRRAVVSGSDPGSRKRVNTFVDMRIAFSVGPRQTVAGGLPILLVTGDADIADAARAAGVGDKVMSLPAYLQILPRDLLEYGNLRGVRDQAD